MSRTSILAACAAVVSCSSPPPQPLSTSELVASLDRRDEEGTLRAALELVDLDPLFVPGGIEDGSDPLARARQLGVAQGAEVRAARRRYRQQVARAESEGWPGAVSLTAMERDLDEAGDDLEMRATVDVLGLLGLGPAPAARALADQRSRRAYASFEQAAWEALFAVDAAALALAAEHALLTELEAQLEEARAGLRRLEALDERGRLPGMAVGRGRAAVHLLARRVEASRIERQARRTALAQACGVPMQTAWLDALAEGGLEALERSPSGDRPEPRAADLARHHPELRAACLDYAIAEATLRAAVRSAWPSLRLGPRLGITPDDLLLGGVIQIDTPWPGSRDGVIEAALEGRERAREAAEDALLSVMNRRALAVETARRAESELLAEAAPALEQSARAWRSVRALFLVDETAWDPWTDAMNLRTRAIESYWRAREAGAAARLAVARESFLLGADDE